MDLQEGEVAVPIDGFPEYFITNRGRVWSTKSNKWLKATYERRYYYSVSLQRESRSHTRYIHRLVGLHFLPVVNIKGALICHKNEELLYPDINFVENLWVGTYQQNSIDCEEKGRGQKGKKKAPFTEEHKRRMSEVAKGKKKSLETRRRMSDAKKGKKRSPETIRRMSEGQKGKKRSPETRRRMKEGQKRRRERESNQQ